jgi:MerR family transcriptional regulator, thiopeptide resistance regulator
MKSHYTVAEFAELAGVTVKALHHYARLGLLRARRSDSGYRLYAPRDLERLEQIVALKSVGLALERIRVVLDGDAEAVAAALAPQRRALEQKRAELDRLIRAIERVEATLASTRALSCSRVLNRLIEAIDMQNDLDVMERYFKTEAAWMRGRRYFEAWPTALWRELFHDVHAALGEDPESDHARSLAARWDALFQSDTQGDFAFRAGLWRAWHDFHQWPDSLKRPVAEYDFVALWKFIAEVSWARVGPDGRLPDADPRRAPDRVSQSKIELFRAIAASLDADADGGRTRHLVAQWRALVDDETGGDEAMKASMSRAWTKRRQWPAGFQRYLASLYDVPVETWTKVADVLANAAAGADHLPM